MLSTEGFLNELPTSKEDWRYEQLPSHVQDYIDTSYVQIEEISDEKQKIINYFKNISLPVKKLHEESMREVFLQNVEEQTLTKIQAILHNIVDHFNTTFELAVSKNALFNYPISKEKITFFKQKTNFLKAYYTEGKIIDINKAGEEKMISDFHEMVHGSRYNGYKFVGKVGNKKIKFDNILYYNSIWNDGRLDYDGKKKINDFFRPLSWFEYDKRNHNSELFLKHFFEDENVGIPYNSKIETGYDKITGFKSYKNGGIDIYFGSNEIKEKFIKTFNLKIE